MLPRYLLGQAQQATVKRLVRLESIRSAADVKTWQDENRRKFLELIGGLPREKTPLNARLAGEIQRDGYSIRKVIFESLPEFYVTANLYVPASGAGPFPGVLVPNGHSRNGKAYPEYQHLYIGLVKRGYVVLTFDFPGQGERFQFWDYVFNHRRLMDKSNEHGMIGIPEYLLGRNLARELIWDSVRALDYLVSLPEVDPARIGVTGNSGGGALTLYLSMLDPRVKAASIVTYVSSIPKKIEARAEDSEADPEQDIVGLLGAGLDHTELVGMIAPRPVLLGAAIRDFFPIEGTRKTFAEAKEVYRKAGAADHIDMVAFDHEHYYSQPLREATTAWFDRWLKGAPGIVHEPAIQVEDDRTLECTPTGQVLTSLGGKRVIDLNQSELLRLTSARRQGSLVDQLRDRLALPSIVAPPSVRAAGTAAAGSLIVEKLLIETEPGIVVPTRIVRTKGSDHPLPAVLYIRDREGSQDDPQLIEELAKAGRLVAVIDVRGFGETQSARNVPDKRMGYYHPRDGMDADFAYAAFSLNRPLLGMRVYDALRALKYLRTRSDIQPAEVVVAGRGWAGLMAAFAAALDPQCAAVAVESVPSSYADIVTTETYAQPVSQMLPGVLTDFDLEDVFAAFAPKPLLILNPENAETRKLVRADAEAALAGVTKAYGVAGGKPGLVITVAPTEMETRAEYTEWILKASR